MGLVAHSISKIGRAYMFGFTGVITEEAIQRKARQYPKMYTTTYISKCRKNIGRWATDCSGLIDIYLGIDYSASRYFKEAIKKGMISTIPKNIPGILVFKKDSDGDIGHVGVCIGDGTVVEAKGIDHGVVRTVLANNGWDLWAYCHLITYDMIMEDNNVLKKGDENESVRSWQKSLLKIGISVGTAGADADFGSDTETATNEFKGKQGLEQNGIVDDVCWAKMALALMALVATPIDISPYIIELGALKMQIQASKAIVSELNRKYDEITGALAIIRKH